MQTFPALLAFVAVLSYPIDAAEIASSQYFATASVGDTNVTIECEISSDWSTSDDLTWRRKDAGGERVLWSSSNQSLQENNSISEKHEATHIQVIDHFNLFFSRVKEEDFGEYFCDLWSNSSFTRRVTIFRDAAVTTPSTTFVMDRCHNDHMICRNYECFTKWRCDGNADCHDYSDETNCPGTTPPDTTPIAPCPYGLFPCKRWAGRYPSICSPIYMRCDGMQECAENGDERNCPVPATKRSCDPSQFSCDNGLCVSLRFWCDGYTDCLDEVDERSCNTASTVKTTTCPRGLFTCDNRRCVPLNHQCDGDNDCWDGSDERLCTTVTTVKTATWQTCSNSQFTCDNGRCVPLNYLCDGDNDCLDGSDERLCNTETTATRRTCYSSQFTCDNGHCVPLLYRCDGDNDCGDRSDERLCSTVTTTRQTCHTSQFSCDNGLCVPINYRCDSDNDCGDGSDERYCNTDGSFSTTWLVIGFTVGPLFLIITCLTIRAYVRWKRNRRNPNLNPPIALESTGRQLPTVSSFVSINTTENPPQPTGNNDLPPSYDNAYQVSTPSVPKQDDSMTAPPSYYSVVIYPPPPPPEAPPAFSEVEEMRRLESLQGEETFC